MTDKRSAILERIAAQRGRQFDLPGSESDVLKSPNDWIACATSYLGEVAEKRGRAADDKDFIDSFEKAAGVIVAALEHVDAMIASKRLVSRDLD